MNKKFLSAILFGALMITSTGTFVSCKDYDDDIENLQEQINNLATKADVEAKLAQLQTALAAAQADAAKALAEAKAADDSAEIAALQAKIDAFKSCSCDVEAMMAEIKDATDAQMAEYKAEIEALIEKTEDLVGEIASLVTDVELILTDGVAGSATLPFITATQVENEGWGPNKELTFTKDAQTNFGGSIVARVSPTNAVPTASSISFINSKGDDLSALIEVGTPKKFEGVLAARAAETGLWEIPYDVKSYTAASLASAKFVNPYDASKGKLLYALAINNMSSNEEGIRNVVSGYDLTIADAAYVGTDALFFKAGGELVTNLKNRNGANGLTEYKWAANQSKANRVSIKSDKTNVAGDTDDNRVLQKYLSVKVGVPFDVVLTDKDGKALAADKKAYRFYVTLDKAYAEKSSEPSELNAWENYAKNTTGLNVLDTEGKVTITINDATAEGDIIGYRVYAVNYDGTVVDPDGKAFYVYVGNGTAAAANLTLAVTPPYNWSSFKSTAKADFSTANWGRATTYSIAVTDPSNYNANVTTILGATETEQKAKFVFYNADGAIVTLPSKDAVKVEMVGVNPANLKDGVTYVATFTAKSSNGVVATATVSFTKQLPEFPSSVVYPFTNVLQDNVLHIYPVKSTNGMAQYDMTNVWHGLVAKGNWTNALAATVSFDQVLTDAEKQLVAKSEYPTITYTANDDLIKISDDVLDPNNSVATQKLSNYYLTEFPVNVAYSYGNISYAWDNTAWNYVVKEWKPVGNEIKMVFRNYAADLNIEWNGEVPTLYYPGKENVTDSIALDKIKVTDWYGKSVDLSKNNDYFTAGNVDIKLLTGDNNEVDEYYEATIKAAKTYGKTNVPAQIIFTSKVKQSQGTPVPTTIKVVITDKFGYEVSKSGLAPFSMSFTK